MGLLLVAAGVALAASSGPEASVTKQEPVAIVVGHAIGHARIGMSEAALVRAYGAPSRRAPYRDGNGAFLVFRVHGAELRAAVFAGRVTSIETTSSYYRTATGVGVGRPLSLIPKRLPKFRVDHCIGGYSHRTTRAFTGFYGAAGLVTTVLIASPEIDC